ncbi:hypothetical protein DVH29_15335 [Pelagibacterium lacus]|uniref:Uncharacterized protein n=1 Tax=Pelagibacterium lacus TaxID=2282655 RepID=A0A369W0Z5_9HYPH|nr:hypothetical protein DVH29_15335 [Pelagibacterium lacus]
MHVKRTVYNISVAVALAFLEPFGVQELRTRPLFLQSFRNKAGLLTSPKSTCQGNATPSVKMWMAPAASITELQRDQLEVAEHSPHRLITASAIMATIADARAYKSGR